MEYSTLRLLLSLFCYFLTKIEHLDIRFFCLLSIAILKGVKVLNLAKNIGNILLVNDMNISEKVEYSTVLSFLVIF